MTTDEVFGAILQQNEIIISLLARLVWRPEQVLEIVTRNKRDPRAYIAAYNALDGAKTGTQVAALASVTQQTMSAILQAWLDEGIILNLGTEKQPKYKGLMRIAEIAKKGRGNANSADRER